MLRGGQLIDKRYLYGLWTIIGAYAVLILVLSLSLEPTPFRALFSESGPFERLSIAAWLLVALIVLVRIRPLRGRALSFALLFALFAAREADWHKAFTADSLLKLNYYRQVPAPLIEKLFAATMALLLIGLLLYWIAVLSRWLWHKEVRRSLPGHLMITGVGLLILGKFLDRAPAVIQDSLGITLAPWPGRLFSSFEEGLELLTPLLIAAAVWFNHNEQPFLNGRPRHP